MEAIVGIQTHFATWKIRRYREAVDADLRTAINNKREGQMRPILLAALFAVSSPVLSAPTEQDRASCRKLAIEAAELLTTRPAQKIDFGTMRASRNESGEWTERTGNYMIWAKSQRPDLNERELITLGNSYCVSLF
ncbi:MAG: hypothetical protein ACXV3D_09990 [Halobacteriota archaeon]